jgi:DNA-binding transcriptional LysR family regulator
VLSNDIKVQQLRAYQAIMVTGSVTAAAERLHMTQPSISRQLLALEEMLGLRLFDRTSGGKMTPTPVGLKFYHQVEGTLSGLAHIPDIAKGLLRNEQPPVRIGATPPLTNSPLLSNALRMAYQAHPDMRLVVESRPRQDIEEWIVGGQIDVALALLPVTSPFLDAQPLLDTSVVAVLAKTHPLAKRKSLSPGHLEKTRLILPHRQLLRILIDQSAAEHGYQLKPDIEASSALTCCRFAAEGMGVAICDSFSPTAISDPRLCVRRWEPTVSLTYGVLLPKRAEPRPVIEHLLECLRRAVNTSGVIAPSTEAQRRIELRDS